MKMESKKTNFFEKLTDHTSVKTERKEPVPPSSTANQQSNFYDPNAENPNPPQQPKPEQPKPPVDPESEESNPLTKAHEENGMTNAVLVAGCMDTLSMVAERCVYVFGRFSSAEKETITRIIDMKEEEMKPEEVSINRKFLRITKKHDEIRKKLEMSDAEIKNMARGFAEYNRVTGKSASPQVLLWCTIINALVNRSANIFLDI